MENNETTEQEVQQAPVEERTATELDSTQVVVKKEKKHSNISKTLNKYFHHIDRGGTLKGEVCAGIIAFFLSICMIIMNVQVIAHSLGVDTVASTSPLDPTNIANAEAIVGYYMGSIIIAFVGSLLMGLVARLPFVQISLMGLSSSMICLVGSSGGLSYYNILFVSLIASVIYVILVSVPVVKKFVFEALPKTIRKILPAAVGIITIVIAMQASGLFTTETLEIGGTSATVSLISGVDTSDIVALMAFISAIIAIVAYFILRALGIKHKVMFSFVIGTLVYILILLIMGGFDTSSTASYINFGRVWVIAGSQSSDVTPFGDSYLTYIGAGFSEVFSNFGKVFTEGTQFAEGVNAAKFIIYGTLCYLFIGMYDAEGTLQATQEDINRDASEESKVNFDEQKGVQNALIVNAAVNVAAPFFGVGSVSFSRSSVGATKDNGKSGIVPIVASIGYLISLFILAFGAIFATSTYTVTSMNAFNYFAYGTGGFVELFMGMSFGIADAVMVCLGASMLKAFKDVDWSKISDAASAITTVVASLLFMNLACGVALGVLVYIVFRVGSFVDSEKGFIKSCKENFIPTVKDISIPTYSLGAVSLVLLCTM